GPVPVADTLNWDPMVDALAAQRPLWEPGSAHGYHGRTFGWLVGEVVRRVSGRSPGQFVAEEIAAPLGADFFIGLPDAERDRVARLAFTPPPDFAALDIDSVPEEMRPMVAAAKDPNSLYHRAFQVTDPPDMDFNSVEVQAAQIPSSNGIGTARGLARIYASLIGEVDGVRLLNSETRAAATREQSAGTDRVLAMPTRFGSGFMLPTPTMPLTGPTTFGHPGRGGSLAFAAPDRGLAFAYVTDHIIEGALDTRASSLLAAIPS
ncbi:MAG: beta-lactamase family protein, partial [Mycobacterium sp.]|nr:beta-lactamase family protein [Mycobacterium sp.]